MITTNQLARRLYTKIYKLISNVSHAFIVQYNRKTLLLETRWYRLPVVIGLPDRRGEPLVLHHAPHIRDWARNMAGTRWARVAHTQNCDFIPMSFAVMALHEIVDFGSD